MVADWPISMRYVLGDFFGIQLYMHKEIHAIQLVFGGSTILGEQGEKHNNPSARNGSAGKDTIHTQTDEQDIH